MTPDGAGAGPSSPSWRRALRSGLMAFVPVSRSLVHSLRTYRLEKGRGKNPLPELSRRSVLLPLRSGRATPHLWGETVAPADRPFLGSARYRSLLQEKATADPQVGTMPSSLLSSRRSKPCHPYAESRRV